MINNEPVSLTRQTIYCLIPILDIYAAYRVKRLRKYILVMILVSISGYFVDSSIFSDTYLMGTTHDIETLNQVIPSEYTKYRFHAFIIEWIGTILIAIYLVRRWSKQWNKKFENPQNASKSIYD